MSRRTQSRLAHREPPPPGSRHRSALRLDHGQARRLADHVRAAGNYRAWVRLLAPDCWVVQVADARFGGIWECASRAEWDNFLQEAA